MSRFIAILNIREDWDDYNDHTNIIAMSITNWDEVTDEEYKLLIDAQYHYKFRVIERIVNNNFVTNTVKNYTAYIKAEEAKRKEEKKKREEAALQRKLKKEAKTREQRKKLFDELSKEFKEPE